MAEEKTETELKEKQLKEWIKIVEKLKQPLQEPNLELPKQFKNNDFRFLKLKPIDRGLREKGIQMLSDPTTTEDIKVKINRELNLPKAALENDWTNTTNYSWDDVGFTEYLKSATGYGVLTGKGSLVVIDTDDPVLVIVVEKAIKEELLPETFKVKTSGGFHYYFHLKEDAFKKLILEDKSRPKGEQHVGEVQWLGQYVVAPGGVHPISGQRYQIVNDVPIANINAERLSFVLKAFITLPEPLATKYDNKLNIFDILTKYGIENDGIEYQGSHPIHGSTSGTNFHVTKNHFFCFRCYKGGGPLHLIAVLEKLIKCDRIEKGCLKGDVWLKLTRITLEKYGIKLLPSKQVFTDGLEGMALTIKCSGSKWLYTLVKDGEEIFVDEPDSSYSPVHGNRNIFSKIKDALKDLCDITKKTDLEIRITQLKHSFKKVDWEEIREGAQHSAFEFTPEEEEKILKNEEISDNKKIVHTNKGIYQCMRRGEGWTQDKVYIGPFFPLEQLLVDGFKVFRYKSDLEVVDSMGNILRKMKDEGGVLSKNNLDDAVNAVCLGLPIKTGHATPSVYLNEDKLHLCLDESMPIKDEQRKVKLRMEKSFAQELNKENLEPYFKVPDFWHSYEALVTMGMSVIAPFALELRKKGKLVPSVWLYSLVPGLGKSTLLKIFSLYLFSIFPSSGDSINSAYRFSSVIDSIGAFRVVDEVGDVNWHDKESMLKEYPENYILTSRGTGQLRNIEYLCRAVLGFSSNRFRIVNEATLVRIFKTEFDCTKAPERAGDKEKVDELGKIIKQLKPIGWRLVEIYLGKIGYSPDILIERIEKHEKKLSEKYSQFLDPRRNIAWAICYEPNFRIFKRIN